MLAVVGRGHPRGERSGVDPLRGALVGALGRASARPSLRPAWPALSFGQLGQTFPGKIVLQSLRREFLAISSGHRSAR